MANAKLSAQASKTWLLQVENLSLVRECRRRISDEFGIKLQLSSDDLLDRIQGYADRSNDRVLQRLARPIGQLLRSGEFQQRQQLDLSNIPVVAPKKMASGWAKTSN
jgi:hypothetical protein